MLVEEEHPVGFDDIHQYVHSSVYMAYNRRRAEQAKKPAAPLDVDQLLQMDPKNDPRLRLSPDLADNWYEHNAFFN